MESSKELVLITGITGFVGSWVGKTLVENGKD
jgi:nucleoside-diphosphate-sugar epimerase